MVLRPKALDHLALKVTDMDRALHFYHQVLGLELLRSSGPNEAGGRSAVLQAGEQKIDVFSRPDFVSADKDKPVGMDHLCLLMEVESIDRLMAYLQQAGVEMFWGPVERHGTTSVYVYDPDGMHVELRVDTAVETAT
jgi:catechol 2,3-dioxygenase-like lactoylglutathione lyase family enzyme